ncbi:head maturation protease, ClpP-related [Algivirga pacifica]|uniref:ATP-dependent Clp protease proteolytic subunit n=1 Tax=Algivirga pacifica TaxID=1162670 RepID=A0ABP9D5V8_9BACT
MKIIAKGNGVVKVRFYGDISEWGRNNARSFNEFLDQLAEEHDEMHLHLHCNGGDVMEGLAMFNAIRNVDMKVIAYVDGIVASMATIVILACDEVYMPRNTYQMIHEALTYTRGNAKQIRKTADLLDKITESLFEHYLEVIPPEAVEKIKKMMDGEDHWLTAQECKDLGIITEVISTSSKVQLPENLGTANMSIDAVFENSLLQEEEDEEHTMKDTTKASILALGVSSVTATDEDQMVSQLVAHTSGLQAKVTELSAQLDEMKEAVTAQRKQQVTDLLEAAVKDGRIIAEQKPLYETLAQSDEGFESVKNIIGKMPVRASITDQLQGAGGKNSAPEAGEDRSQWTWEDFQAKAPEALEAMEQENFEKFAALYEKEFGTKPAK